MTICGPSGNFRYSKTGSCRAESAVPKLGPKVSHGHGRHDPGMTLFTVRVKCIITAF